MASYIDIRSILFNDDSLKNRVDVATMIAADDLLTGTPTESEQKWAAAVFADPRSEGNKAFRSVLAANNGLSVAAIQGATDAALQTKVDLVVPNLVVAFNA